MDLTKVDQILDRYGRQSSWLVMMLQDVQQAYSYLPDEALRRIAREANVPMGRLYNVATFYSSLSLTKQGQYVIRVCDGTACHLRGAVNLREEITRQLGIKEGETTEDGLFTLEVVACLGACALAPVMAIGGDYHGQMTPEKVRQTLEDYRNKAAAEEEGEPAKQPAAATAPVAEPEVEKLDEPGELAAYARKIGAERSTDKPCITVCGGTGCRAGHGLQVAEAFREVLAEKNLADKADVHITGCHGFCEQGPLVVIRPAGTLYVRVKPDDAGRIVAASVEADDVIEELTYRDPASKARVTAEHDLPFYANQQRMVLAQNGLVDPTNIDDYIALGGYAALEKALTSMQPEDVIEAVEKSGLRGRGGGGFPTGRKWRTCRAAEGYPKYVICNGDEGDPGAFMDRSVMEGNPHVVLEGLAIGAWAIGSDEGYIYVRLEYPLAVENLKIAIAQAEQRGLLGKNILGTDFSFTVQLSRGAGAFVCGEETALIASLQGQAGEPKAKRFFPAERGLFEKPTIINNVETWANIPRIVERGPAAFSAIGSETSKGTKVFSLVGKVKNTGLVEVPMGISLRKIIYDIGGGVVGDRPFKAVQTGGPSGGCLPENMLDLPVDFDHLTEAGSMMGSGGMIVMDDRTCMVEVARYFTDFLRRESCGKCTACREGVTRMGEILGKITLGQGEPANLDLLEELCNYVRDNSICGLGKTAPNPALSAMKNFRAEYEAHVVDHKCPAGVCKAMTTFTISEAACKACGRCLKVCPTAAITGQKKVPHVIDQDKCVKCGSCRDICPFDAVSTQ